MTLIRHIVLMRFTDPGDAALAKAQLDAMPAQIPSLLSLRVGLDIVRSESSYDLVLESTHEDLSGLEDYVGHPVHQAFREWAAPRLAARAVVDCLDL